LLGRTLEFFLLTLGYILGIILILGLIYYILGKLFKSPTRLFGWVGGKFRAMDNLFSRRDEAARQKGSRLGQRGVNIAKDKVGIITGKTREERNKAKIFYDRALAYENFGELSKAVEEYKRAIGLDTRYVEAYIGLGDIYRRLGEIGAAIEVHAQATVLDLNNAIAHTSLGVDFEENRQLERAINQYQRAISLDNKYLLAQYRLRDLYIKSGLFKKAYEQERQILKMEKSNDRRTLAYIQTLWGDSYLADSEFERAIRQYRRAIRDYDRCRPAYLHLGDALLSLGRTPSATKAWGDLIKFDPTMQEVYERLNKTVLKENFIDNLLEFYEQIKLENPACPEVYVALASLYTSQGILSKAIEQLQSAEDLRPEAVELKLYIGDLYYKQGDIDQALIEFEMALDTVKNFSFKYICQVCGFISTGREWRCPKCGSWDSFETDILKFTVFEMLKLPKELEAARGELEGEVEDEDGSPTLLGRVRGWLKGEKEE